MRENIERLFPKNYRRRRPGALGDGVIPGGCAHLEGAEQITLEGVLHSINEAGTTLPTERWYGSEAVVDRWLTRTLELLE